MMSDSAVCAPDDTVAASRTYSQFRGGVYNLGDLSQYVYQEPRRRHG